MFSNSLLKFNKNIPVTSYGTILLLGNLSGKCFPEAIDPQKNRLLLPKEFFQVVLFPQILIFDINNVTLTRRLMVKYE